MKNNTISFIAEGNVEAMILQFFGIHSKMINRASGSSDVAKSMQNQQHHFHKLLVGLIDEDPKKNRPRYFDDFVIDVAKSENNLLFKRKPNTNHYLIIFCPEFEAWILDIAKSVNINPIDHQLPTDPGKLHNVTQLENIGTNKKFNNFLNEIRKREAQTFKTLKSWLVEFTSI